MARRPRSGPLNGPEEAAWRAMVRALVVLPRVVEGDLIAASRLNMAEYTVMAMLSEHPDRAMRMRELADGAALSTSGLTRVIDRLARQGVVERERAPQDGRGQVARLTEKGVQRLKEAYPSHVESVRRRVLDHFDDVDLDALAVALNAIGQDEEA